MHITLLDSARGGLGPGFRQNKYNAISYTKKDKVNNLVFYLYTQQAVHTHKYIFYRLTL